jgi:hypothetical protein
MTTALQRTDSGALVTLEGEVAFDPTAYLASLDATALKRQQALSAAYDNACRALIGPNDVQKEGAREFKKKSAWRKLARYFGISTAVTERGTEVQPDGVFFASVVVRASAPWGQFAEAVGACGTDEEVGQRKISRADALATAETRATNRAVSNLIAMGEVSAEEIGDRKAYPARQSAPRGAASQASAGEPVMPFGKTKGTPLSKMATDDLEGARRWAMEKGKFAEFQEQARVELERRMPQVGSLDEPPEGLDDDAEGGLPF